MIMEFLKPSAGRRQEELKDQQLMIDLRGSVEYIKQLERANRRNTLFFKFLVNAIPGSIATITDEHMNVILVEGQLRAEFAPLLMDVNLEDILDEAQYAHAIEIKDKVLAGEDVYLSYKCHGRDFVCKHSMVRDNGHKFVASIAVDVSVIKSAQKPETFINFCNG